MRRSLAALLTLLALATPLAAGGLRDLADAWLIPEASTADLLRVGAANGSGWSLVVSQGRLFAVDELAQLGLAMGRRWSRVTCRIRWERLGRTLYREDQARVEVLVGGRWRFGGEVGFDRLALAGEDSGRMATGDLRIQGRLAPDLRLDIWWPLVDAPPWHGRQGLRRWWRLVGHRDGWSWAVVADRRATGAPVCQGEVLLRLAPIAALGLRLEPWSGAAGICTAWRLGDLLLRTSHLVHPDLGPTHRWSLGLGRAP